MNRHGHRNGDVRSLLLARRGEASWLYDRVGQDFRRGFDLPVSAGPEITFREPAPRPRPSPRSRVGRVLRWLFVHGGISVVFLLSIFLFTAVAWALGYR